MVQHMSHSHNNKHHSLNNAQSADSAELAIRSYQDY